jgi:hypothetical protein
MYCEGYTMLALNKQPRKFKPTTWLACAEGWGVRCGPLTSDGNIPYPNLIRSPPIGCAPLKADRLFDTFLDIGCMSRGTGSLLCCHHQYISNVASPRKRVAPPIPQSRKKLLFSLQGLGAHRCVGPVELWLPRPVLSTSCIP